MSNTKSNWNRTAGPQGFGQRNGSFGDNTSGIKNSSPDHDLSFNQRELSYAEARDHLNDLSIKG